MPRPLRAEIFTHDEVCIVHCMQRCVRRAYLAGVDALSGRDYQYRREWIRQRMEKLASVFAIDILTYAIMSNHLHVVLRNRPDVVQGWSNMQVALRWLQIFPGKQIDQQLGDPTSTEVEALANNSQRIAQIRQQLSDISWFMRALCEPIARRANREEETTGSFWEGRYKAQRILDEAGLLACCMYVDLNPIRAAMADKPETSKFTSVHDRILGSRGEKMTSSAAAMKMIPREEAAKLIKSSTPEQLRRMRKEARQRKGPQVLRDAWLAELTLTQPSPGKLTQSTTTTISGRSSSSTSLRASEKGFLSMSWQDYLALLDWTGRSRREGKRGSIPENLQPILARLGIESTMWSDLVWDYKRYWGKSSGAGSPKSMQERAAAKHRSHIPGQRAVARCFIQPPTSKATS
jgi:hypothetical protein